MFARQVASHNIVDPNEIKVATQRKWHEIAIEKHHSDSCSLQPLSRPLADLIFVGGKFKWCKEHTSHGPIDEVPADFLCVFDGQVRSLPAIRPKQAVIVGPRKASKFPAKNI